MVTPTEYMISPQPCGVESSSQATTQPTPTGSSLKSLQTLRSFHSCLSISVVSDSRPHRLDKRSLLNLLSENGATVEALAAGAEVVRASEEPMSF